MDDGDSSKNRYFPRMSHLSMMAGIGSVAMLVILRLGVTLLPYSLTAQADPYDDRDCEGVERELARVCIVASEFEGIVPNGGIGTFYSTLAQTLVSAGHQVTLLFTQGEVSRSTEGDFWYWQANYAGRGIDLVGLEKEAVSGVRYHATTSWAAYGWLRLRNASFDVIHFADFQGHGYYTVLAKYLGLSFANTTIAVTTHGPIRWALTANGGTLNSLELAEVDFLEQQSIRLADVLMSPSRYLLQWHSLQGWTPRNAPRVMPLLVPQAARQLVEDVVRYYGSPQKDLNAPHPVEELVFFGRFEVRKGIVEFCDAVDEMLSKHRVKVLPKITFLGSSRNKVNGRDSREYVDMRSLSWSHAGMEVTVYDDKDTKAALLYLLGGNGGRCAVLPSRVENSPQAVMELMGAQVPFIASSAGGIPELIAPGNHGDVLFQKRNSSDLARRLVSAVRHGVVVSRPARSMASLEQSWVNWHARAVCPLRSANAQQTIGALLRGGGLALAAPSQPPAPEDEAPMQTAACILLSSQHPGDLKATVLSLLDQESGDITAEIYVVFVGLEEAQAASTVPQADIKRRNAKVSLLHAGSRGAGIDVCAERNRQPNLLVVEAGVVLARHAVQLMASVIHRAAVPGVTAVVRPYPANMYFDTFDDIGGIRKALAPSQQRLKLFLGPAIRSGIFENTMGSEIVCMTSAAWGRLGQVQALLGPELDFWEVLAAATLRGEEIQVIPEPLVWARTRSRPARSIADLRRLLAPASHNFSSDELSSILQGLPEGVTAVTGAKGLPRAIVPDA